MDTFRFDFKRCLSELDNSRIIRISSIDFIKCYLRTIKLIIPTVLHTALCENLLHYCKYFFSYSVWKYIQNWFIAVCFAPALSFNLISSFSRLPTPQMFSLTKLNDFSYKQVKSFNLFHKLGFPLLELFWHFSETVSI